MPPSGFSSVSPESNKTALISGDMTLMTVATFQYYVGQNFLRPEIADRIVAEAYFRPGELVIELGAGLGAITIALARRQVEVVAIEIDPVWAKRLCHRTREASPDNVRVVEGDFLSLSLPSRPFRVIGSLPFGHTTDVLRRLLENPYMALERADLIVQWEVARKRAALPPSTLRSTTWLPWWEFRLGRHLPAAAFRHVDHCRLWSPDHHTASARATPACHGPVL